MTELIPEEEFESTKYTSKNKSAIGRIKRFFIWLIKSTIHSFIFYYVFYLVNLPAIEAQYDGINFYLVLIAYVAVWTFLSDLISNLLFVLPILLFYYFGRYTRGHKRRNWGVWLWEYIIYLLLRVIVFALMLTQLLTWFLTLFIPYDFAFVLSWIIVSLVTIYVAKFLARIIIST
jgi:hypothetical protein